MENRMNPGHGMDSYFTINRCRIFAGVRRFKIGNLIEGSCTRLHAYSLVGGNVIFFTRGTTPDRLSERGRSRVDPNTVSVGWQITPTKNTQCKISEGYVSRSVFWMHMSPRENKAEHIQGQEFCARPYHGRLGQPPRPMSSGT